MSELELLEADAAWWSPFVAVLFVAACLVLAWAVLHALPLLLAAHRRGRERVRAAKHRRAVGHDECAFHEHEVTL